jgi:ATP-dependent protease ClpP protease subunit
MTEVPQWIAYVSSGAIFVGIFVWFFNRYFTILETRLSSIETKMDLLGSNLSQLKLDLAKTGVDSLKSDLDKTKERLTMLEASEKKQWGVFDQIAEIKRVSDKVTD